MNQSKFTNISLEQYKICSYVKLNCQTYSQSNSYSPLNKICFYTEKAVRYGKRLIENQKRSTKYRKTALSKIFRSASLLCWHIHFHFMATSQNRSIHHSHSPNHRQIEGPCQDIEQMGEILVRVCVFCCEIQPFFFLANEYNFVT